MNNLAVYCARCNGSGVRKDGATACGLCQQGVIGVIIANDLLAALQEAIASMGVRSNPMRSEEML